MFLVVSWFAGAMDWLSFVQLYLALSASCESGH